jgi:Flp pilus assembly protein TadD
LEESNAVYLNGAALCPGDWIIRNNLANSYWAQGRATEAVALLRECLEVSPTAALHNVEDFI